MRTAAVAGVLLVVAFAGLGLLVAGAPGALDRAVADTVGAQWEHAPGRLAAAVSLVLGPVLPFAFSVALLGGAAVSWRRGRRGSAWLLVRCFALLWVCRAVSLVKGLYRRQRPRAYPEFSYPSGHVVSVACVAVTAAVVCGWLLPRALRAVLATGAAAVLVTALCRVVLDVHWLTDVLGSVLGVGGVGLLTALALRLLPVRADAGVTSVG